MLLQKCFKLFTAFLDGCYALPKCSECVAMWLLYFYKCVPSASLVVAMHFLRVLGVLNVLLCGC